MYARLLLLLVLELLYCVLLSIFWYIQGSSVMTVVVVDGATGAAAAAVAWFIFYISYSVFVVYVFDSICSLSLYVRMLTMLGSNVDDPCVHHNHMPTTQSTYSISSGCSPLLLLLLLWFKLSDVVDYFQRNVRQWETVCERKSDLTRCDCKQYISHIHTTKHSTVSLSSLKRGYTTKWETQRRMNTQ